MPFHLRIARPVSDLARSRDMYCRGLGLRVVGAFEDHEGFDGVMLAAAGDGHHFEFTSCRRHPVPPSPTVEDLVVFYVPVVAEWHRVCADMVAAGFVRVRSHNPYWEIRGRTFEDRDGYRVVVENAEWRPDA
ncbi:MAG TPA: VOC family protein [Planctomycetota bacterium]|nr:VOC family protein [Planctomycetota bacterium]